MMAFLGEQRGFPDPIDNKKRWCRKNGRMYLAVEYEGGMVRWVEEGSVLHHPLTGVHRLHYTNVDRFVEWLRGGPLEASEE